MCPLCSMDAMLPLQLCKHWKLSVGPTEMTASTNVSLSGCSGRFHKALCISKCKRVLCASHIVTRACRMVSC